MTLAAPAAAGQPTSAAVTVPDPTTVTSAAAAGVISVRPENSLIRPLTLDLVADGDGVHGAGAGRDRRRWRRMPCGWPGSMRAAGARGLDDEPVVPAGRVGGGDDARTVAMLPTNGEASPVPWTSAIAFSPTSSGPWIAAAVGVGAPAVKSAPLTAVLPWEALRDTELTFDGAGVGTPPAESLAVARSRRSPPPRRCSNSPSHRPSWPSTSPVRPCRPFRSSGWLPSTSGADRLRAAGSGGLADQVVVVRLR